ncbi:MAG: DUF4974 domain-containing protein [Planctomycetota bacterium]|nr:DUF4974 domain-containing protein [Planctomycetota bacterium]
MRLGRLVLLLSLAAGPAGAQSTDAPRRPPPPARSYIESVLAREPVALRFSDTPLADVVRTLQDNVWINVVLAPEVDRGLPITFQAERRPLGPCLDELLRPHGLSYSVWCEVVLIHPQGGPPPPEPPGTLTGNLQAYSVQHAVVPFPDALTSLADLSGVRYELTPEAVRRAQRATVTLRVRNLPLHHVVTLLSHQVGLRWSLDDGAVWFHVEGEDVAAVRQGVVQEQADARVTVLFEGTPLVEAAATLQALTGVTVRIASGVARDLPVTLQVAEATLAEALDLLARDHGVAWRREGTSVVILNR